MKKEQKVAPNQVSILAALSVLAPIVTENRKLMAQIKATPEPELVTVSPIRMAPGEYPATAEQVLVTRPSGTKETNEDFRIITQEECAAEAAKIKEDLWENTTTGWQKFISICTGTRRAQVEAMAETLEFKNYKFNEPRYVIDKTLYSGPATVKSLEDDLDIKLQHRLEMMKTFLTRNEVLNETLTDDINPALRTYNATAAQKLPIITEEMKNVAHSDLGIKDENYRLPGFSHYTRNYEELEKSIAELRKTLAQELGLEESVKMSNAARGPALSSRQEPADLTR